MSPGSNKNQKRSSLHERLHSEHTERQQRIRELSENYYSHELVQFKEKRKSSQQKSERNSISHNEGA